MRVGDIFPAERVRELALVFVSIFGLLGVVFLYYGYSGDFSKIGSLGVIVYSFLDSNFGYVSWLCVVLSFFAGYLIYIKKCVTALLAPVFCLVFASGLLSAFAGGDASMSHNDFMNYGGVVGFRVQSALSGFVGLSGTIVLLFFGLVSSLLAIFGKTYSSILLFIGKSAGKAAFPKLKKRSTSGYAERGFEKSEPPSIKYKGRKKVKPTSSKRAPASKKEVDVSGIFSNASGDSAGLVEDISESIEAAFSEYSVKGEVIAYIQGPVVTQYRFKPSSGTKMGKIHSVQDDISRSLAIEGLRISGNIPGTTLVGVEIPNDIREIVRIGDIIKSKAFKDMSRKVDLPVVLGSNIDGTPLVYDLASAPHLLLAGQTGSGKSCGINSLLASILFNSLSKVSSENFDNSSIDVRLILIDPKQIELSVYEGLPHLMAPIITSPQAASRVLSWAVDEMEKRYALLKDTGTRSMADYNFKNKDHKLPRIVIVIDEFADLMLRHRSDVEPAVNRLLAKARAAGMHIILATQRPSTKVIDGTLKANLPTRICFKVASRIDSRVVIENAGGEKLLGAGDMLFMPSSGSLLRAHGSFIEDSEVESLVGKWREFGPPVYDEDVIAAKDCALAESVSGSSINVSDDSDAALMDKIIVWMETNKKVSVSKIQRVFKIGYNRAGRLMDELESRGLVSQPGAGGVREVLK